MSMLKLKKILYKPENQRQNRFHSSLEHKRRQPESWQS